MARKRIVIEELISVDEILKLLTAGATVIQPQLNGDKQAALTDIRMELSKIPDSAWSLSIEPNQNKTFEGTIRITLGELIEIVNEQAAKLCSIKK